jgi:hypothetical protein
VTHVDVDVQAGLGAFLAGHGGAVTVRWRRPWVEGAEARIV